MKKAKTLLIAAVILVLSLALAVTASAQGSDHQQDLFGYFYGVDDCIEMTANSEYDLYGSFNTNSPNVYMTLDPGVEYIARAYYQEIGSDNFHLHFDSGMEGDTTVTIYLRDADSSAILDSMQITVHSIYPAGYIDADYITLRRAGMPITVDDNAYLRLAVPETGPNPHVVWTMLSTDSGYFKLRNEYNGRFLSWNKYGDAVLDDYSDSPSQEWKFVPYDGAAGPQYMLVSRQHGANNAAVALMTEETGVGTPVVGRICEADYRFCITAEPAYVVDPDGSTHSYDGPSFIAEPKMSYYASKNTVHLEWTEIPETGYWDKRMYYVVVCDHWGNVCNGTITAAREFSFKVDPYETYTVELTAVNDNYAWYTLLDWYTSTTCQLSIQPTAYSHYQLPFSDVKEEKYYYEAVLWAYYHNPQITGGTDSTHFSPNKKCTREQIVSFIYASKYRPAHHKTGSPFSDVKKQKYYYNAVMWAVEKGITGGVGDGTKFGVGRPCTREQVVTFLWKAAGAPEPASTDCPFTDVKPGKYYYNAILWAVEHGITSGLTPTSFGVGKACTRAQVVSFLYKAVGQQEG